MAPKRSGAGAGVGLGPPTEPEATEQAGAEAFRLFGAEPDRDFDLLAQLAAEACGTPMAGVTFITADHQYFKASIGVPLGGTPRDESFCQYTVDSSGPVVVRDAARDERFSDSPLVTGEAGVRFYAGAPLRAEDGAVFGALCVMDSAPRDLGAEELKMLEGLARQATSLIQRGRDRRDLAEAQIRGQEHAMGLYAAFDAALDPILIVDGARRCVHANRAASALFGYDHGELLTKRLDDLVPAAQRDEATSAWEGFLRRGELRGEVTLRRADGVETTAEYSASSHFVPDRHMVVLHDVTERRATEVALRDSNLRLEETQALALVGSWEWNLQSELRIVSPELLRILGRPAGKGAPTYEEFAGYVHPDDRDSYNRVAAQALADKRPFKQIFRVVSDSGEVRTIESHGRVEVDEHGDPSRMYGAAQDITDREHAEQALRLQADVLHQLPVGIIASDSERRINQWNRGAHTLFGIPADEALGKRVDDLGLFAPGARELRERMQKQLGEGLSWEGEIELRGAGGRVFPALVTNSPTRDHRGEIIGYVSVTVDLAEQRDYQRELLLQGQLLDQVGAAVIGFDRKRRVTHWNRGAEQLTGWRREETSGKQLAEIGLLERAESTVADVRKHLIHEPMWEGELEMKRKDGSCFPTLTSVSATHDEHGGLTGFVGVAVDITARKRAEQEARRARMETLNRLSRAVETRDHETGGHIERIGEISAMLAERLGLEPDRVELIRLSSPMHDVGKIGIPDEILLKPSALSDAERTEMERHALIGHDILAGSSTELLDMAATIALTHHERVDGGGYPQGLSGERIPLEGRIVAVADVLDALTSDRGYRKAMSTGRAIGIMWEGRGSQFDPSILDLLLADIDAFVAVKGRGPG